MSRTYKVAVMYGRSMMFPNFENSSIRNIYMLVTTFVAQKLNMFAQFAQFLHFTEKVQVYILVPMSRTNALR